MATLGGLILNRHNSQYDPGNSTITRRSGCVWTTGANGADASTGGTKRPTPDTVHNQLPNSEEQFPKTPGWTLPDLQKALARLSIPFEVRSGKGWAAVVTALDVERRYVVLSGDSDRFPSGCSGEFDGDHSIGVFPATRVVNGLRQRWINDPICPEGRWEFEYIIRNYAVKFSSTVAFGVFSTPVPKAPVAAPVVTLRYGGVKIKTTVKRIAVPAGRRANVRARPTTSSKLVTTLANGKTFTAYQRTKTGQLLAGSRVWFGDRTGTRWLHISSF